MATREQTVKHIFLIGAKSLGAYGGYETFINKLTEYHQNDERLQYHAACKANGSGCMDESGMPGVTNILKNARGNTTEFTYHNTRCFKIRVPSIGPAVAIYYDIKALDAVCRYVKEQSITDFIVYIMACRIGPFMRRYCKQIHRLGGKVYLNPDGHEWMRAKWSRPIRWYWKKSEELMVRDSDLIICDSVNIERYILDSYPSFKPQTTFIAYGAETRPSIGAEDRYEAWLKEKGLRAGEYYLVVGRFVPENNYETMIREFMQSHSTRDFAIITTADEKFLAALEQRLHFRRDPRIKFVGTVYDSELLMKIREEAYGYFHGHEVGGTNPSLLEALGATSLNLLLAVGFNQEVAQDAALYWTKEPGDLALLIDRADAMEPSAREELGIKAKERIRTAYSWEYICSRYAEVFLQ